MERQRFFELFSNLGDVLAEWGGVPLGAIQPAVDADVLFAYYCYEDYSGNAIVVFRHEGKLYEVNGGHCSCYGLEDCGWQPEETFVEALAKRDMDYEFSGSSDAEAAMASWKAMLSELGA